MNHLKDMWTRFHASFHDSEVIIFARLQLVGAALWYALQQTDMSIWIADKHALSIWMTFSAFVTEWLRRRRADFDGGK